MTRKYVGEFCFTMVSAYGEALRQDEFGQIAEMPRCHIYMICRRPRIMLDTNALNFGETSISGRFLIQDGAVVKSTSFELPNYFGKDMQLTCEYPFTDFTITDNSGAIISRGKAADLMSKSLPYIPYLNLEVVYVGQSFGREGSRVASDRIVNHSALQRIYADTIRLCPDKEVWIVPLAFDEHMIASFDGRNGCSAEEEEELAHIKRVFKGPMTEKHRVSFTEAALIRYFRPMYNDKFKDQFPMKSHSSYSECYDLDLNAVCVVVHAAAHFGAALWSPAAAPKWIHECRFELHSREERESMFDF